MVTVATKSQPYLVQKSIDELDRMAPFGRVFEWGAGGSTVWLGERSDLLITVEHDKEWVSEVSTRLSIRKVKGVSIKHLALDPFYEKEIQAHEPFDLVVVDGRRRVLCVAAAKDFVAKGGHILVDNTDRARYAEMFKILKGWKWTMFHNCKWSTTIWSRP